MSDIVEVVDTVSDTTVTLTAAVDDGYEAFLDDVERCHQAELDAEMDAMHAAAVADGLDLAAFPGFGDLSSRRHAEIMAMFPVGRGWLPILGLSGDVEQPYTAELRRGTPNGPDVIRVGKFITAENALTAATLFAINMVLVHDLGHGDDATREAIRGQIEYAAR